MKTSQAFLTFAFTLALTSVGCSAKVSTPDFPFPDFNGPSGTSLSGKYTTGCVRDEQSGVYMNNSIEFAGTAMKVDAKIYMNSGCQNLMGEQSGAGTFAIVGESEYVAGAAKVDYELKWDDGRTEKIYDIVLVEGAKLFMGSQQGTNPQSRAISVDRTLPYTKSN